MNETKRLIRLVIPFDLYLFQQNHDIDKMLHVQLKIQLCLPQFRKRHFHRMLEFIELKVLLRAKEVKMYFIYMALNFARNTTEHKELWPRFRKDQNVQEKMFGRLRTSRYICLLRVWVHFIELFN